VPTRRHSYDRPAAGGLITTATATSLRGLDLQALDQRALQSTDRIIALVRAEHLGLPTPCRAWTLRELLQHLVSENRGFAANAVMQTDLSVWTSGELGDDPYRTYRESAAMVTQAFSAHDIYERRIKVREFGVFDGRIALGMHFVDYLVHGWDVAKAIGVDPGLDEELSKVALAIAMRWPYDRPDAAFEPRCELSENAPVGDQLVAYLGRSPAWPE